MAKPVELLCAQCGNKFMRPFWVVARRNKMQGTRVERTGYGQDLNVGERIHFCGLECQRKASSWYNPQKFRRPKIREMSDLEAAWFAALLDGEGTIIFPREFQSDANHPEYVRITIKMTDKPILDVVARVVGQGKVRFVKFKEGTRPEHWLDQWSWEIYGLNARALLQRVLPWLIVKRDRALKTQQLYFGDKYATLMDIRSFWDREAENGNGFDKWWERDGDSTS